MKSATPKYDYEWFKKRAFDSLLSIAPHVWDYSDSLLLYIFSGADAYETLQEKDSPYFRLITKPEREYLEAIAKQVVNLLPVNFNYIDLGPGTEHKEQFFFDELKKQGKKFTYIPVDISEHYLKLAEKNAKDQEIPVRALQASFEELPEILGEATVPRFVNLGLTFSNYEPQTILSLLKSIAGKNGYAFINSQIRDRVDMAAIQAMYAKDALTLADDKLKLLGLEPSADVTQREADSGIKAWCSIINLSSELKERGIEIGDKLLVFQTLRYTVEQLEAELKKALNDYQLFDTGAPFVGALIKT